MRLHSGFFFTFKRGFGFFTAGTVSSFIVTIILASSFAMELPHILTPSGKPAGAMRSSKQWMENTLPEVMTYSNRHGPLHKQASVQTSLADGYDYCMVFPTENGELNANRGKHYLHVLELLGFEIYAYQVIQRHPASFTKKEFKEIKLFVLLRASVSKLREHAERCRVHLLLDPMLAQQRLEAGDPEHGIAPVLIRHEPDVSKFHPTEFIYGPYKRSKEDLYFAPMSQDGSKDIFQGLLRLRLTTIMLESRPRFINAEGIKKSSENLKLARYLRKGWLLACFPLHNQTALVTIYSAWKAYPFIAQPIDSIQSYFGEKLGLYYAFMDFYTKWLVVPAMIAVPLQAMIFVHGGYDAPYIPCYAAMLSIWSVLFCQQWVRHQRGVALRWGSIGTEDRMHDRSGMLFTHCQHSAYFFWQSSKAQSCVPTSTEVSHSTSHPACAEDASR